jgi:DNA-binding MarR family transcriptional regulator
VTALDRKAHDLRLVVDDILRQFRKLDVDTASGPLFELSCQELHLVENLGDYGPKKMSELAELLLVRVNTLTGIVDNLEKKDLARRERSDEDRRVVRVALTDAGLVVYDAARREKTSFLRKILGALTEDEQDIYMLLMRKVARAARGQDQKANSA